MTHNYHISGMTCEACEAKIVYLFKQIPDVQNVSVDLKTGIVSVEMQKHVPTVTFQEVLTPYPKYRLSEPKDKNTVLGNSNSQKSWLETYKPIVLIFSYISVVSFIITFNNSDFEWMLFMRSFMAGFFLTFSFFKMLNLKAFAESYAMYDVVAQKIPVWGYVYAFLELILGIAFAVNFNPFVTNLVTLIVMTVSIIGVLKSVLNQRKIQCACLGTIFNLPMSTVTIIEDALMILMSLAMLLML
ncbi:heavy-metal-associated domain-containing protein [Flavobacterium sp. NST-5]|uniref:Heavy-metal-associated domain-containing protein n=1 Tax=Flavobacterium ichthyis TaxID=2698827 RepID=A0ABW9ZBM3_9FLAO|nr:heavy metal-associated domain-containing protein [Flavobacterium ichthyis]NBL65984.1 heavy-metal-associated domain-containing protein [Flavobacterium ichthyis]